MFNIGDRIAIKAFAELPEESRTSGMAKLAGKEGVIYDICQSTVSGTFYKVQLDGKPRPSTVAFTDEMLTAVSEATYEYEFSYLDKVVVAMLYEVKNGQRTLVARGHGHIIHDGLAGISQAASYALRRIDLKVRGVDATT